MMAKILLFAVVAFLAVTNIMGRTADIKSSEIGRVQEGKVCSKHGYPCSSTAQCCNGMRCNSQAGLCQVDIKPEELQAQREKVLSGKAHVDRGSYEHTTRVTKSKPRNACGRDGADCATADQCCDGLRCNSFVNRCEVIITAADLQAQREKVLSGNAKVHRGSIERSENGSPLKNRSGAACGKHGDGCVTSDQCCEGMRCHAFLNQCEVHITPEILKAQIDKIKAKKNQSNQ